MIDRPRGAVDIQTCACASHRRRMYALTERGMSEIDEVKEAREPERSVLVVREHRKRSDNEAIGARSRSQPVRRLIMPMSMLSTRASCDVSISMPGELREMLTSQLARVDSMLIGMIKRRTG